MENLKKNIIYFSMGLTNYLKDNEIIADAPLNSTDTISRYSQYLTDEEINLLSYIKEVYFIGPNATKTSAYIPMEQNRYNYIKNDHIIFRYKLLEKVGSGAFSNCFKAYDFKEKKIIALKIIRNEYRFNQQVKIEIKILSLLLQNDKLNDCNVVHMLDYFTFRGHSIITFELLENNMYIELKDRKFRGYDMHILKSFSYHVLTALKYLKQNNIVHCDLKPENIVVDGDNFKVIDFGSATIKNDKLHTYIQSRYYRAPEITLKLGYDCSIDMWSFGCILYELYSGNPLFGAKDENDLIHLIIRVLGLPSKAYIDNIKISKKNFFRKRTYDRKGIEVIPESLKIENLFDPNHVHFIDFIKKCITWNSYERMTPEIALNHAWIIS